MFKDLLDKGGGELCKKQGCNSCLCFLMHLFIHKMYKTRLHSSRSGDELMAVRIQT